MAKHNAEYNRVYFTIGIRRSNNEVSSVSFLGDKGRDALLRVRACT